MDGLPALDLWDVVIEVLRSSKSTESPHRGAAGNWSRNHKSKPKQKGNRDVDQLSHVDHVTANANSSQGESQLYIFGHNEAVIKLIIKGRSPTMRHVSRTHRVALDWLFDRIKLDPKIQIKDVDTKNQLADMVTKGSFTRDKWDHLLRLLKVMNFSMFSCSHFLSNGKQSSGKHGYRRFGSGETETDEFGVKEPPERKENLSERFECFEQPCESRVGSEFCFMERRETDANQQRILRRGNKMTLNLPATGNWGGVVNLQAQPAPGNRSEVRTSKSEGQRWNSTTCRSPTIDRYRRPSRTCGKS